MTHDDPMKQPDDYGEPDDIYDAEMVKIAFCPDCDEPVIVLGEEDRVVAVAHLHPDVLDRMIEDLQSIRQQMNN
jgi:hypothetical protein